MTTGEMLNWTNRFKKIMNTKVDQAFKNQRLANMMMDMEEAYNIPALKNEQFEEKNPCVMQMYRTASFARMF